MRVYLGLGSNLGDRRAHLRLALQALRRVGTGLTVSPLYETAPVGGPQQGPYLNCVVGIDTDLGPFELLSAAQQLESAAGRVRTVKDGPRTLDVDILLIEGLQLATPELTVPHPRMHERAFVLAPLEDLDPALVAAGWRHDILGAATLITDVRKVGMIEDYTG